MQESAESKFWTELGVVHDSHLPGGTPRLVALDCPGGGRLHALSLRFLPGVFDPEPESRSIVRACMAGTGWRFPDSATSLLAFALIDDPDGLVVPYRGSRRRAVIGAAPKVTGAMEVRERQAALFGRHAPMWLLAHGDAAADQVLVFNIHDPQVRLAGVHGRVSGSAEALIEVLEDQRGVAFRRPITVQAAWEHLRMPNQHKPIAVLSQNQCLIWHVVDVPALPSAIAACAFRCLEDKEPNRTIDFFSCRSCSELIELTSSTVLLVPDYPKDELMFRLQAAGPLPVNTFALDFYYNNSSMKWRLPVRSNHDILIS